MTTGRRPTFTPAELDATLDDDIALGDVSESIAPPPSAMTSGERRRMAAAGDVTLEAVDMANTEWARGLEARLIAAEARSATAEARSARAERWLSLGLKIVGAALGCVGIAAVAVLKLAMSSGERTATERGHLAEHAELRAAVADLRLVTVPALRASIAAAEQAIANLRGTVDLLSRLGAVRVAGPPVQPLLPDDGDP